jgi:hypothetical protein
MSEAVPALTPSQRSVLKRLSRRDIASRNSVSLWDSAAVGITGTNHDSGIRVLARGRVHARQNLRDVDRWRADSIAAFLGEDVGASRHIDNPCSTPSPLEHSPGHYHRKYGNRSRRLKPVSRWPLDAKAENETRGRADSNLEMRARVWTSLHTRLSPSPKRHAGHDMVKEGVPPSPGRPRGAMWPCPPKEPQPRLSKVLAGNIGHRRQQLATLHALASEVANVTTLVGI